MSSPGIKPLTFHKILVDGHPSPFFFRRPRKSKSVEEEEEEKFLPSDGYYPRVSKFPIDSSVLLLDKGKCEFFSESFGQDSFLFSPRVLSVADGVGGWRTEGVDSQKMSRQSVQKSFQVLLKQQEKEPEERCKTLLDVVKVAYAQLLNEFQEETLGGTTLCMVYLHPRKRILEVFNLGDSGFAILRKGKAYCFHRGTLLSNHELPQLSISISNSNKKEKKIEEVVERDMDGYHLSNIAVLPGDWVLLGTDGVWDNLGFKKKKIIEKLEEFALTCFTIEDWLAKIKKKVYAFMFQKEGKGDDMTLVAAEIDEN